MPSIWTEYVLIALASAFVALLCAWGYGSAVLRRRDAVRARELEQVRKEAAEEARIARAEALLEIEDRRVQIEARHAQLETLTLERERAFRQREETVVAASAELEKEWKAISHTKRDLEQEANKVARYKEAYRYRLRKATGISEAEAREAFSREVRELTADEIQQLRRDILKDSEDEYRQQAQRIMVDVMQRISITPPVNTSATVVNIPNEEMKGRIIGREGRNIRAFETTTGVTLMIDETPGSILVSSFDPVRREVARIALERLIHDGRIHPSSIEDTVEEVTAQMQDNVVELGENALIKLHLAPAHPEVITLLGKLYYRLSNNQNTLEHSIEVSYFCSLLASELGLDPVIAKRCGLFHDLGKAIDHELEGSHAMAAARLLQRHGEDERVVNAVAASHGEVQPTSVYAALLHVADALSASRPGARADSMEGYIQRIRSLEDLARQYNGVDEVYAVQAGREIRVIVQPEKLTDEEARHLSHRIRRQIEDELQYPGTIKITVIRESRFTETAR